MTAPAPRHQAHPDRALVQGEGPWYRANALQAGETCKAPGTVSWAEHVAAWTAYAKRYGNGQSAQRIHDRGGFSFSEIAELLGHEPETWEPR